MCCDFNGDVMIKKTIREMWLEYELKMFDASVPKVVKDTVELAFYAGVGSVLTCNSEMMEELEDFVAEKSGGN